MAYIDYYKILGIDNNATEKDIKNAYRKAARKYHPDLNPGNPKAEQSFKEINEANEVLSNPENRKKYDKYGKDWEHADEIEKAQQQRGNRTNQQGFSNAEGQDFSDFFESMFGGGASSSHQQRNRARFKGQDYNTQLALQLVDVFTSHQQVLDVNGSKIRFTIPAGIENEQVIKIPNKGAPGINGGPNGDLYIKFVIENNTKFKRDGSTLYANVDLDVFTALIGGEINVDTFNGIVKLKVAPLTQNTTKVKLKGKGFPVYKKENEFGDLIITYQIKIPTNLTESEINALTEIQKNR